MCWECLTHSRDVKFDTATTTWFLAVLEREPGPHFEYHRAHPQPIDMFEDFFDFTMVDTIVVEINKNAVQGMRALGNRHPNSQLQKWTDTDRAETWIFLTLILAISTSQ